MRRCDSAGSRLTSPCCDSGWNPAATTPSLIDRIFRRAEHQEPLAVATAAGGAGRRTVTASGFRLQNEANLQEPGAEARSRFSTGSKPEPEASLAARARSLSPEPSCLYWSSNSLK